MSPALQNALLCVPTAIGVLALLHMALGEEIGPIWLGPLALLFVLMVAHDVVKGVGENASKTTSQGIRLVSQLTVPALKWSVYVLPVLWAAGIIVGGLL